MGVLSTVQDMGRGVPSRFGEGRGSTFRIWGGEGEYLQDRGGGEYLQDKRRGGGVPSKYGEGSTFEIMGREEGSAFNIWGGER